MRRLVLVLGMCFLLSLLFPSFQYANATSYTPMYHQKIRITNNIPQTLYNYPVKIVLNSSNIDYMKFRSDGGDIRFKGSGIGFLGYWIEKWNPGGESIIWVKVPKIPGGGETYITMYHGDPYASNAGSINNVMEHLPADDGAGYVIYYEEWVMPENHFSQIGDAMGWHEDDESWSYSLPFSLPYYSQSYDTVYVCSNGFVGTTYSDYDYSSSEGEFIGRGMIAPFWADLMTYDGDIYIDSGYSDIFGQGVYIRWNTTFYYYTPSEGVQNFVAVLYENGIIRFDYGEIYGYSDTDDTPIIGVSYGDNNHYSISTYNGIQYPSNYNSVLFWPRKKADVEPSVKVFRLSEILEVSGVSNKGFSKLTLTESSGTLKIYTYLSDVSKPGTWRYVSYNIKVIDIRETGNIKYIGILINYKVNGYDNWLPGYIIMDYSSGKVFLFGPIMFVANL